MQTSEHGWQIIDPERGVYTHKYTFGDNGSANTVALRMAEGELLLISPPRRLPDGAWEELASFGEVVALLVPNAFHTLGVERTRQRFPQAQVFAHPDAHKRLRKRLAVEFAPFEELQRRLPEAIEIFLPPEVVKCGEVIAWIRTPEGTIWYTTDIILDLDRLPNESFLLRILFRIAGMKLGFQANPLFRMFFAKDKRKFKQWFLGALKEEPPVVFILGHGPAMSGSDIAERIEQIFDGYE